MKLIIAVADCSNIFCEGPRTIKICYDVMAVDVRIWESGMNETDIDKYTREKVDAVIGRGRMWDTECSVIGTYDLPTMSVERFERLKRWLYQWADWQTCFYEIRYVYDTPVVRDQIREEIGKFLDEGGCGTVHIGMLNVSFDHKSIKVVPNGVSVEMTVSCIFTPHYSDHKKISRIVKIPDAWAYFYDLATTNGRLAAEHPELIEAMTDAVVDSMEDMSGELGTELHCYTTMNDEVPVVLRIGPDPGYEAAIPWLPGDQE